MDATQDNPVTIYFVVYTLTPYARWEVRYGTKRMGYKSWDQRVATNAAKELARRLTKAMADNRLHREFQNLVRPKLLIIDEVGYLTLDAAQASLVFQAIAHRYEKQQPIILTSNKAFSEWGRIFAGDVVMASAALDRLLHRCTVINIRGESYRLKEKRQAAKTSLALTPAEVAPA